VSLDRGILVGVLPLFKNTIVIVRARTKAGVLEEEPQCVRIHFITLICNILYFLYSLKVPHIFQILGSALWIILALGASA
jgi:hypothetical protein